MQQLLSPSSRRLLAAALMLWLGMWVFSCTPKDDTAAILELIEKATTLAEAHDIGELMDLTTEDFMASPGRNDDRATRGVLFMAFQHYRQFNIHFPRPAIELNEQGDEAEATIYFTIVREGQDLPGLKELYDDPKQWLQQVGDMADLYRLNLQLKKIKKQWLVYRAHLEGFKGFGF